MLTVLLFGLISLLWMAMGLTMIAIPSWWSLWIRQAVADPVSRFLLAQGMILTGLLLVVGASTQGGYWLWVTLGSLSVAKALVLLGSSESLRMRLLTWWGRGPVWTHRLAGVVLVALATLLAIDTIRGGQ
ncbi:MAG: hypothetical protein HY581_01940 [Nitrospirae bacterium]|nr:hypothetical protein [Nitrospirota bacterium]